MCFLDASLLCCIRSSNAQQFMRSKIKAFIRHTRSALAIAPTVATAVITGSFLGAFNLLEWEVRDTFFHLRPTEGLDPTIVVVTIDEADIRAVADWPIPDGILAELIEKIAAQQPRSIGMDLYRDLPEEPGHERLVSVFKSTPALVGVEKVSGGRVSPPPTLAALGQVGLADLVLDTDRKVRRALLTSVDEDSGEMKAGLATQVALSYLAVDGISLEAVDADRQKFQLGQALFEPLRSRQAGYPRQDLGGYQILLNWRGGEDVFVSVPMRDVLSGQIDDDLMRDRIVFIGSIAPSTNDFFETPYSNRWRDRQEQVMPGVFVHANIASQLIQSALYGRTGMVGFTDWQRSLWIIFWTLLGTGGSWIISTFQQRKLQFRFFRGIFFRGMVAGGLLVLGAYSAFTLGLLVPVVAPLTALTVSGLATVNAHRQKRLQDTNAELASANNQLEATNLQLASANNQLTDYSKTLEQRVAERTHSLAKAKQAADAANQAKSDFLANMSHELRTPLNGILGYAQILERADLAPAHKQGVSIIHQCGSHLLTLINDILDLSKIEARKLELHCNDFDFLLFLDGVAEICRIRAEQKGIAFHCEFSPELPPAVRADEKRLRQVLINLLGNAIKFTDRGCVTLSVSLESNCDSVVDAKNTNSKDTDSKDIDSKDIDSRHTDSKDTDSKDLYCVRFQIEDTGVGMTPEQIEKIFLPFEQVGDRDRKAAGTGLGLAISQRIAEMMNSPLQVSSELGKGSTFWLTPTFKKATSWVKRSSQQIVGIKLAPNRAAPRILVIDRHESARQTIAQLLAPLGFVVTVAKDAEDGLQAALAESSARGAAQIPDCAIAELGMVDEKGIEVVERLRSHSTTANIKIIVCSTHAFEQDRQDSLAAGADFFLPKPLELSQLLETLQLALKIEWIYATTTSNKNNIVDPKEITQGSTEIASNEAIIPPDKETLDKLYHLTMMGDLNGLKGMLDKLEDNPDLITFSIKIKELIQRFQTKQIREFIKSFIST